MSASDPTSGAEADASAPHPAPTADAKLDRTVARGTATLVGAQFLTTPISIILNMVLTRRLGAEEFGTLFLAGNLTGLVFLFVDWGQTTFIAGATARDPDSAPRLLGTGLALKLGASLAAAAVLWGLGRLLHYNDQVQLALALTSLQSGLTALSGNLGAVLRGRERLDRLTQLTVFGTVLNFALVIPAVLLGGHIIAVLVAQILGSAVSLALYNWRVRQLGVRVGGADRASAHQLLNAGSGFLLLGVVLSLQPAVDSVLLSKLASAEVVGWYSAARRFIGFLIFPATTLNYALYPTLSRVLHKSELTFLELSRSALRVVVVLGVPAAVGCVLFASPVIRLFSGDRFLPAAPVLQVLSIFVFFVYFTIIIGAALAALNLQLPWALAQLACVAVSAIGDPLMVPWCQRHFGNGAIGIGITCAISEMLMVGAGIWLAPRGLFDRSVLIATARSLASGVAMVAVGLSARSLPWPVATASSVLAYAAALMLLGGLNREQRALMRSILRRRDRLQR